MHVELQIRTEIVPHYAHQLCRNCTVVVLANDAVWGLSICNTPGLPSRHTAQTCTCRKCILGVCAQICMIPNKFECANSYCLQGLKIDAPAIFEVSASNSR